MFFLIEYVRPQGRIVRREIFRDWSEAEDKRLQVELDLNKRGIDHEVVLLDAAREEMLHKTHQRYFENIEQIATTSVSSI